MSEWQPIETAPKDGTRIIMTNGAWVDFGWFSHSVWLGPRAAKGAWVGDDPRDGRGALDGIHEPTHWMPLPAPPSTKA